jgi:hypothetical protein
MVTPRTAIGLVAAAFLGAAAPAAAHHALIMFSPDKELVLTGTVKEFRYQNPHVVVQVLVPGSTENVEWTVLTEAPSELEEAGINRNSLQPGEQVTMRVRPAKSGVRSGWLLDIRKQDGTILRVDD